MTTITKEWLQQTIAEFENTRDDIPFGLSDDDAKILIVLKRALASLERERIRREHAEWSDKTFGDVGPVGPLKHLSKEVLEAAADPSDPLEWADMQFLLWDAQRRMGISDEFITRAMVEKLAINKGRQLLLAAIINLHRRQTLWIRLSNISSLSQVKVWL